MALQAQLCGRVVVKEFGVVDVAANHPYWSVSGLFHDGAFTGAVPRRGSPQPGAQQMAAQLGSIEADVFCSLLHDER